MCAAKECPVNIYICDKRKECSVTGKCPYIATLIMKNKLFEKPTSYKSMSECLEWNLTLNEVRYTEVNKLSRKIFNLLKMYFPVEMSCCNNRWDIDIVGGANDLLVYIRHYDDSPVKIRRRI